MRRGYVRVIVAATQNYDRNSRPKEWPDDKRLAYPRQEFFRSLRSRTGRSLITAIPKSRREELLRFIGRNSRSSIECEVGIVVAGLVVQLLTGGGSLAR